MLSYCYRSSVNQTGASSPSLSLLFPSPSTLLSPPIAATNQALKRSSSTAYATDVLQQMGAYQPHQSAASMAATISYLHSSLSMTPTSPQTSSSAGTPAPIDISQMVFGSPQASAGSSSSAADHVAKANSGRASVVVQKQQQQKVIPPPPSLIPMSVAVSSMGNKELLKMQETLQQLQQLKSLTATYVTPGRNTTSQQQAKPQQHQQKQQQQQPNGTTGYGHYKNNPNLATIRPASGRGGGVGVGGSSGVGVGNDMDYMLRAAAAATAAAASATAGGTHNRNKNSSGGNGNKQGGYLNQMLSSADVIDLSSTTTPTRSNASAAAAAALQQHQQYLQQQQLYLQQHAATAVAAQQRAAGRSVNGGADLANCLNLLANQQQVVGRNRASNAEDLSATNLMNKQAAMANAPYKMQKAFIEGVQVTCINMKAYQYTDLLMRVQDLCDKFFPQSTHENCRRVLEVFNVVIYRGNR